MNTGNYENFLIREANGEDWPLDRTEATADWFDHDLDAAHAISAEEPSRSEPADFLGRVGSKSAVRRACKSDKTVNSGEDVCVPASPEIHPTEIDYEHFGYFPVPAPELSREGALPSAPLETQRQERESAVTVNDKLEETEESRFGENFGSESEPYTIDEINTRRKETNTMQIEVIPFYDAQSRYPFWVKSTFRNELIQSCGESYQEATERHKEKLADMINTPEPPMPFIIEI